MAFVQIIQYRTSKVDEVRRVHDEWEAADSGGATQRALMCEDRDNPGQYLDIVFFESYEAAMEHSASPVTQQFAQRMMALTDGEPTFYNLDVVDDRQLG